MPDGSGGKTDELDVRTDELDGTALELDVGTTVELDDDEGVGVGVGVGLGVSGGASPHRPYCGWQPTIIPQCLQESISASIMEGT